MKIKLKENSADIFSSFYEDYEFEELLFNLQGKLIEVNTENLFKNEYYIDPIEGLNMREPITIPDILVAEVIDDERFGKYRCMNCQHILEKDDICDHCGKTDYIEPLFDEDDEVEEYYDEDDEEDF